MTFRRRWLLVALAAAVPLLAAGCGEQAQVTVYKQGKYQGKPDTPPWSNKEFADQTAWEKAINGRTKSQDEYVRVSHGV